MKKLPINFVMALLMCLFSCDESSFDSKVELPTNASDVLSFEDDDAFKSFLTDLEGKQTSSARVSTNDFESFEYHFQNVLEELDSAKTESEYFEILSKNSDILYVTDSVIQPKI